MKNPYEKTAISKKEMKEIDKYPNFSDVLPHVFNLGMGVFEEGAKRPKKKKK